MTCSRCGARLIDGHVYCDKCGAEVQVVPDFNELEEDILPTLVSEEPKQTQSKQDDRKRSRYLKVFVLILLFVLAIGGVIHLRSYDYAFIRGRKADSRTDYSKAASYYLEALKRKQTVEAYINLGNDYFLMQMFSDAEDAYRDALFLAKERNQDLLASYDALLTLFEETGDVDAASALYDEITQKRIREKLAAKFVQPPSFSEAGGVYNTDIRLSLSAPEGYEIYFTKNGQEPEPHNGKLYKKPIRLPVGETVIKACSVDNAGKKSMTAENVYTIDLPAPAMPRANPAGGTFHEPVRIFLQNEDEGVIYYTWDGSTPTEKSTEYKGSIEMPEGNNVLSAVVIEEHGIKSDVLRCNYIYLP